MYLLGGGVFFALFAGKASPAYHVSIEKLSEFGKPFLAGVRLQGIGQHLRIRIPTRLGATRNEDFITLVRKKPGYGSFLPRSHLEGIPKTFRHRKRNLPGGRDKAALPR
jgi:hypothetical protein